LGGFRQCLLVSLEVLIYKLSGNHECNALLFCRNVEGISDAYRIDIEADGSTIEIYKAKLPKNPILICH
jgi:hypothetical protein